MAAVNAKMGVRRPDQAIGMQFAHAHQAGISQVHGQVPVLLDQLPYRGCVGVEVEINSQNSVAIQSRKRGNRRGQISEEMQRLSQNAFTGEKRRRELFEALDSPDMVKVRAVQQRHQSSSVSKALFHLRERPKERIRTLLTERSPSLLAPSFSGFSKRSRVSSKQLTGDTASLSRDSLSKACNIRRDKVVFRLQASALSRAFCAVGTLIESVSVIQFYRVSQIWQMSTYLQLS